MKKMIAVILCLVLSATMLLCGCDSNTAPEKTKRETNANASYGQKVDPTNDTTEIDPDPIPVPAPVNEFINESNFFYDVDNLSIRPKHLYWEGDKLVAECFVTNGKSTTAYNLNVKKLSFGNESGTFASGAFGYIDGLTVPAYGYTVWTFTFSGDAIQNPGADLASLNYQSSVSFSS